jgi:RNA polymerase sigma-70 factor (ECF subfamily)
MGEKTSSITRLLHASRNGDQQALEDLIFIVYGELRRLADGYLRRERRDHTLQPTALVHEAFLKLLDQDVEWQNRSHFFAIAARTMRRILVDYARGHNADKRGAGSLKLSLDEAIDFSEERAAELVALDEALTALAAFDPERARLVELRYFAGLSIEETAEAMNISVPTVVRYWRTAKAWLHHEISNT